MRKVLIAVHKPPPLHGQCFIVQQILENLPRVMSGSPGESLEILHLDMRFSSDVLNIGRWEMSKVWLLVKYVFQLLNFRLVDGVTIACYVPAPGKNITIIRDIVLLGTMRILGIKRIFHWQAGGLSDYVAALPDGLFKRVARWAYHGATLSIIPVESERKNAAAFFPLRLERIHNGIPDPCSDFESNGLVQRRARVESRELASHGEKPGVRMFRVLFMGHCSADKGLFDTMRAVIMANEAMQRDGVAIRFSLQVFGMFMDEEDRSQFDVLRKDSRWSFHPPEAGAAIQLLSYCEFVSGLEKTRVFLESDVLCFPSYYAAEVTPTVILDALAHGLPVISTNWRGIPELLPATGLPLCAIKKPDEVAMRLVDALEVRNWQDYRDLYATEFTIDQFMGQLAALIKAESNKADERTELKVDEVKVVVFAHTPPPYHGQSIMVKSMLDALANGADCAGHARTRLTIFHVNARLASSSKDIGAISFLKGLRLLGYCFQALFFRFFHGAKILYYIPAPAKFSAIARDWVVMIVVRPFFEKLIFQHRAIGLGLWMESPACSLMERLAKKITMVLMRKPDLSMVLTAYGTNDAAAFKPKRTIIVPNGKKDPCPDYQEHIAPERDSRLFERNKIFDGSGQYDKSSKRLCYRLLFMGLCCRTKGLLDAVLVAGACRDELDKLGVPLSIRLTVAGDFSSRSEREEFDLLVRTLSMNTDGSPVVDYVGFLDEKQKNIFLREHDQLIFPTFYEGEAMPGVILEAMAYGLDVVTTNWREVNMLLPKESHHNIDPGDIMGLTKQILGFMRKTASIENRSHFLKCYSYEQFINRTIESVHSVAEH